MMPLGSKPRVPQGKKSAQRRAVTQAELARQLGVTQETVSHALRGTGTLSQATRDRVRALAREAGYRPHAIARSMQRGRFDAIGLLASTGLHATPLNFQFLRGLYEVLHASQMSMIFARMPDEEFLQEEGPPRMLSELMVDALILNLAESTAKNALKLVDEGAIPAVFVNEKFDHNCVYPDERGAGAMAAHHLIGLGHRKVTYFEAPRDPTREHFSTLERRQGCLDAVQAAGLRPKHWLAKQADPPRLREEIRRVLKKNGAASPMAYVTGARADAEILLLELLRAGIEPGRVTSLLCIDNNPEPFAGMQITFLRTPFYWLGREAARMALDLVEAGGNPQPAKAITYHDLLPGETCG